MSLTFHREHEVGDEELSYSIHWYGECIGKVYGERGDWTVDSELGAYFPLGCFDGYTRISDVMKELRRVAKGLNPILMESIAQLAAQRADSSQSN